MGLFVRCSDGLEEKKREDDSDVATSVKYGVSSSQSNSICKSETDITRIRGTFEDCICFETV